MPVSGNYGTPTNPNGDIYSSYWKLQWYTGSDPAHVKGDFWGRSDLNPNNTIATLRFDNGNSVVDIPIFATSTPPGDSIIKDVARVPTPNGRGWMPVLEGGGAYNYLAYIHGSNRHGVHDSRYERPSDGVARWTFNDLDTSGTTAIDVWGDFNGSISDATTGVTGANETYTTNEAYSFDGSDDFVNVGQPAPTTQAEITIGLWALSSDSTAEQQALFGARDAANGHQLTLTLYSDIEGGWGIGRFDGTNSPVFTATDPRDGNWHHYVYRQTSSGMALFFDGSSVTTNSTVITPDLQDSNQNIGRRGGDGGMDRYAPATIDDVRVYSVGLSDTQISNWYNTGSIA